MRKWIMGIAMLPIFALAFAPVSAQAAFNMYAEPYNSFDHEYIAYVNQDQGQDEEPEMPMIFITTANLNLRRGPDTGSERIATINRGQLVYVTDLRDGEWFAVTVGGQAGYMYAEFLDEVVTTTPAERAQEIEELVAATSGVVERLTWSEARQLTTRGTTLTIIDVRTGITWQMASFSNGNHSDVETLTATDTAEMLRAWGGRWCWQPRPVHVIVGDRILAASLNGMPHAGWTISGNNMNGHVCLHFYGSRTHNGNRSHERDHQNAVSEAYRADI